MHFTRRHLRAVSSSVSEIPVAYVRAIVFTPAAYGAVVAIWMTVLGAGIGWALLFESLVETEKLTPLASAPFQAALQLITGSILGAYYLHHGPRVLATAEITEAQLLAIARRELGDQTGPADSLERQTPMEQPQG